MNTRLPWKANQFNIKALLNFLMYLSNKSVVSMSLHYIYVIHVSRGNNCKSNHGNKTTSYFLSAVVFQPKNHSIISRLFKFATYLRINISSISAFSRSNLGSCNNKTKNLSTFFGAKQCNFWPASAFIELSRCYVTYKLISRRTTRPVISHGRITPILL